MALLAAMQPREDAPVPMVDFDALHEVSWNQGFTAGREAAVGELASLRLTLAEAVTALQSACRIDPASLRPVLAELVRRVAGAVLMAELNAGAKVLIPMIDAALAMVRSGEVVTLRAHPETLAGLTAYLPDIAVVEDADLPLDGFVVAGTDFVVEAGLQARLDEIVGEIL